MASDSSERAHVLLALSGSVASVKVAPLVQLIGEFATVRVVTTKPAMHFFDEESVRASVDALYTDEDEWSTWTRMGDPVLHIELRKWADCMVVAPLSANTLSKLANGACDNLLTCTARAWDLDKPLLVAPAMNTHMWAHPFTSKQLAVLRDELGYTVLPPVAKTLACGDVGVGAMAHVETIAEAVRKSLQEVREG